MTLVPLNLLFTHLLKRAWKTESMKRKIFRKSLSVRTTIVKHTLLRQPQTNKFCSKIFKIGYSHTFKHLNISIFCGLETVAIIQCQIWAK